MAAPFGGVAEKARHGSDNDADSDAESGLTLWIPATRQVRDKPIKCKGCEEEFQFRCAPGQRLRDSVTVRAFMQHCVDCSAYAELGLIRTCDFCHSLFMNEMQRDVHKEECAVLAAERGKKRPPDHTTAAPVTQRSRRNSTSSQSSNQESNSPDQNDDDADDEVSAELLCRQVQEAAERMIQAQQRKEAAAANAAADITPNPVRRPGPLSRTSGAAGQTPVVAKTAASASQPAQAVESPKPAAAPRHRIGPKSRVQVREPEPETGPIQRTPVVPRQEVVQQVDAGRKLTGKNLSQLLESRRRATPSNPKPKRKPPGSSSKKSSKKKRKSETHSSSDSEEYPEFIKKLPEVVLTRDEYMIHIPSKVKNQRYFNCTQKCPACSESFPAAMNSGPIFAKGQDMIPSTSYYTHCLSKCKGYMKTNMKHCDKCFHRYLNDEELTNHKRSNICSKYAKKMKLLKLKMPWMPRQLYLDILDLNINSEMCCKGCSKQFECNKKGDTYTPGLLLQCHMIDECQPFIESGGRIECRNCAKDTDVFYYISEEDYKKYDACHVPTSDEEDEADDRNDPNSPYYGRGLGKGKGGLE